MALTTAQQVRLRIQDLPTIADVTRTFDGSASAFNLEHNNLSSGTAFVPGAAGWTATGVDFNASGYVTFSAVGSANSAFRVRYVHSVFGDEDVSHFITAGGSVPGAALEAVQALMFDGLKRARWAAPDGTQYDDTMALGALWKIYSAQKEEIADDETVDGGYESWSEGQENW